MGRPWIGVDLDGTLAQHQEGNWDRYVVGPAVIPMLGRVRNWVASGRRVKIFTARVAGGGEEANRQAHAIQLWCQRHGLPSLEVTCQKDREMIELWDDRAVRVVQNVGMVDFNPFLQSPTREPGQDIVAA